MNLKRSQQNCRYCITGDSQCQHRNKCAADRCIICTFRSYQSLHSAFSKRNFRIFHRSLCLIIRQKRRNIPSGSRQRADNNTDSGRTKRQWNILFNRAQRRKNLIYFLLYTLDIQRSNLNQCFRYAKQTNHSHNKADTAVQITDIKGKSSYRSHGIHTDCSHKEPHSCRK